MDQREEPTLEQEPQEHEPQVEDPSQELVTKRVLGKTVEMPTWMADLWDERERDFQRRFSEPTRREQQLQRQQADDANRQARQNTQASPENEDLEWYAKGPTKAMAELRDQLRNDIAREQAEQLELANHQRAWWGRFWAANEDLQQKEWAVRSVVQDYRHELGALDEADCHERLAALTRERLGQAAPGQTLPNRQVRDERSGPSNSRRSTQRQEPQKTLISVIDERRAQRRRAHLGIKEK